LLQENKNGEKNKNLFYRSFFFLSGKPAYRSEGLLEPYELLHLG
jgi:hypothetical protein